MSIYKLKSWKRTQGLGAGAGMGVTRGTADQSGHSNLAQEKGNYHLLMPALCREPLPCGSDGKESARHAGDLGSIPGLGRSLLRRERLLTPVFWPGEFHGLCSP